MNSSFRVEPVAAAELAQAVALLFQRLAADERDARTANILSLVEMGELNLTGVLVVRRSTRILGAIICQPAPGAVGLVWPPQTLAGADQIAVEDALVQGASAWLNKCGAKIGQVLLAPEDVTLAAPLLRNGFAHVTSLDYLRHDLSDVEPVLRSARKSARWKANCAAIQFQPYTTADKDMFHRTLLRTYEDSLDCPEVNNQRSLDEIMAGHMAQGKFNPDRWWLALRDGVPVGTLLLTELPENGTWDLSYVGVVREVRRQGLGCQLVCKALYEAWSGKAWQLTLSVDRRNIPARRLYQNLGFQSHDARECFLALWTSRALS